MLMNDVIQPQTSNFLNPEYNQKSVVTSLPFWVICVILFFGTAFSAQAVTVNPIKWHPGHYMMLVNPGKDKTQYMQKVYTELNETPALRGVAMRYRWAELEKSKGVYDFSSIDRHLQDLATRLAQEHKVAISVQVHSPHPPLDHKHRGLLFQCTRELLLNAIKHAQTYSFDVILNGDKYWATVTVEDHGQGFDVHNLHAKRQNDGNGFGLFHIRQRVEGLGGTMNIESAPKKGTRITLCIPLGNPPGSPDSATRSI